MGQSYCLVFPKGFDVSKLNLDEMWRELNCKSFKDEVWKDIPCYEGIYQVSNVGRVRSVPRYQIDKIGRVQVQAGCILRQFTKFNGYKKVILRKENKQRNIEVHRLVASTFLDNLENKPTVDHIDGNPSNNKLSNLRWATMAEQCNNSRTTIEVLCVEDNLKFPSYAEAGRYYHVGAQYISQCANSGRRCKKINKHFKKYTIADRMSITGY